MKSSISIKLFILLASVTIISFQNCAKNGKIQERTGSSNNNNSSEDDNSNTTVPVIFQQPVSVAVALGQPFSLSVLASGTNLQYQWYKNNTLISGQTAPTISVSSTVSSHYGDYKVKVSNSFGQVTSNVVSVSSTSSGGGDNDDDDEVATGQVRIVTQPRNVVSLIGEKVVFQVAASGSHLTYRWYRDDRAIPDSNRTSITYTASPTYESSRFKVKVWNSQNTSDQVTSVSVGFSMQYQSFQIERACGRNKTYLCKADDDNVARRTGDAVCKYKTNNSRSQIATWTREPKTDNLSFAWISSGTTWFEDGVCNSCQFYLRTINCYK